MSEEQDVVTGIEVPIYLKYNFTAGAAAARFLTQVKRGKLTGQRCPGCQQVYIPPRGSCPACGVPTEGEVELADKATVRDVTLAEVNTSDGQRMLAFNDFFVGCNSHVSARYTLANYRGRPWQ